MKNKTILITGASSGIGYEFAKIFAKENNNLILIARNKKRLEEIKQELGNNMDIVIIQKDLSIPGAAQEIYTEVKNMNKSVDVLINNAGFGMQGQFAELSLERQLNMIQLNMMQLTEMTHLFAQSMVENQFGRILNVGSVASFVSTPSMSVYAATKAYVLSFSESLNSELKGKGDISVTTLCPGPTATNFVQAAEMDAYTDLFNRYGIPVARVAKIGYEAMKRKKTIVVPGKRFSASLLFIRLLPRKWIQRFASNTMK